MEDKKNVSRGNLYKKNEAKIQNIGSNDAKIW